MRLSNPQTTALTTAASNGGTLTADVKANTRASLISRGLIDDNGALTADGYAAIGQTVPTDSADDLSTGYTGILGYCPNSLIPFMKGRTADVAPSGTPTPGNASPSLSGARMRLTGRRANPDSRRADRKAQRNARKRNRSGRK